MGCLLVLVLGGLTAAAAYFIGYKVWVFIVLGVLWLTALVHSLIFGHRGFGGGQRTDLMIVIAGAFITAAIMIPRFNAQQPCYQARDALRKLSVAEGVYYSKYSTYTADIASLNMKRNPKVSIIILKGDMQSFAASASHPLCDENRDGTPDVLIWDSARGGAQ